MAIKYSNGHKIYQHLPCKGPPKFTQISNFWFETNHLATLEVIKVFSEKERERAFF
jgi:hypothetical protein